MNAACAYGVGAVTDHGQADQDLIARCVAVLNCCYSTLTINTLKSLAV